MPVEIKELVIKVSVTPPDSSDGQGAPTVSSRGIGGLTAKMKQEIIDEAVEQVMRILENKKER